MSGHSTDFTDPRERARIRGANLARIKFAVKGILPARNAHHAPVPTEHPSKYCRTCGLNLTAVIHDA